MRNVMSHRSFSLHFHTIFTTSNIILISKPPPPKWTFSRDHDDRESDEEVKFVNIFVEKFWFEKTLKPSSETFWTPSISSFITITAICSFLVFVMLSNVWHIYCFISSIGICTCSLLQIFSRSWLTVKTGLWTPWSVWKFCIIFNFSIFLFL